MPVTVVVTPTQLSVREGEEAIFECKATGRPGVIPVKWYKGVEASLFG